MSEYMIILSIFSGYKTIQGAREVALQFECLPGKYKALSSIPGTINKQTSKQTKMIHDTINKWIK